MSYETVTATATAHWKMQEFAGSTLAQDETGTYHGTIVEAVTCGSTGPTGITNLPRSYSFAGDVLSPITLTAITFADLEDYSIAFWAKATSGAVNNIVCGTTATTANWVRIGKDGFQLRDNAATLWTGGTPTVTAWRHYVVSYDYTNAEVRFYWDGALQSTVTDTPDDGITIDTIGNGWTSAFNEFVGDMADLQVYNTALVLSDVTDIYAGPTDVTLTDYQTLAASAVAHFELDESSGTVAINEVGADGTYTGSPTLGATGLASHTDTAVTFDGVGDYVDAANAALMPTNGTVSFWFDGSFAQEAGIVCKGLNTQTIIFVDDNILGLRHSTTGNDVTYDATGITGAHHWVFTWTDSAVTIYLDGSSIHTGTAKSVPVANADVWLLGQFGTGGTPTAGWYLAGTLDEVLLFDSALAQSDVSLLYTGAAATAFQGPVPPMAISLEMRMARSLDESPYT